ncbi:MAG: hypothetical protein A2X94_14105 [Bdellovibrionales bacterium GWB1_55_8]|nr:MAG: hypothetical protein A2X94_14105 [Bdellovibrionales bacterium GWB1_55_8]
MKNSVSDAPTFQLESLAREALEKIRAQGQLLCFAESCTGGMLASLITGIPGASDVFWGGIVSYQNSAKTKLLNVPEALLRQHGAVSREVARAMALGGASQLLKAHPGAKAICISTTGIAGPDGGTATHPVGLCELGLALPDQSVTSRQIQAPASFNRHQNQAFFTHHALRFLIEHRADSV